MCCRLCCFPAGPTYVHDVSCDIWLIWLCCFPLWPAGGVLHFHPDNVCSEDRDKVSMKHDHCLLPLLCSRFWIGFVCRCFSYSFSLLLCATPHTPTPTRPTNPCGPPPLLPYLCVQMEDSPSPKRQRLSQQSMLDLNSAPPSTPSSPIRPWELPPSRRPHPHYIPERCHTPLRNRRR